MGAELMRAIVAALLLTACAAGTAQAQGQSQNYTCSHLQEQCMQVSCERQAHGASSCGAYCQGKFSTCMQTGTWTESSGKSFSGVQKQ
jgi:uncharacterized membrane protein